MRCCIAFSLLTLGLTALASAQVDTTCFEDSGAIIVTPQDDTYNSDRLVYNEKVQNKPAAIVYAHTENQVQQAILCARANSVKAVPRGGGHGYEGSPSPSLLQDPHKS